MKAALQIAGAILVGGFLLVVLGAGMHALGFGLAPMVLVLLLLIYAIGKLVTRNEP